MQKSFFRMTPLVYSYLTAKNSAEFDSELMQMFSVDQLMELAGLAVAQIIDYHYSRDAVAKVVVVCGPGNNGGDGLVAARHLKMFNYAVEVVYPKRTDRPLYKNLVEQLAACDVPLLDNLPEFMGTGAFKNELGTKKVVVVDSMFGYSFNGSPREPFASIIKKINAEHSANLVETVAVDVPSGWNVNNGAPVDGGCYMAAPSLLISLMLPKLGVKSYKGPHYLGGRFVPPRFAKKHSIVIPQYENHSQFVDITNAVPEL